MLMDTRSLQPSFEHTTWIIIIFIHSITLKTYTSAENPEKQQTLKYIIHKFHKMRMSESDIEDDDA